MKWRVISWFNDQPITIEWEDGSQSECPDHPSSEDWQLLMAIDCSDDCDAAGWEVGEDDCYYNPADPDDDQVPTRWRSGEELPDWWVQ